MYAFSMAEYHQLSKERMESIKQDEVLAKAESSFIKLHEEAKTNNEKNTISHCYHIFKQLKKDLQMKNN